MLRPPGVAGVSEQADINHAETLGLNPGSSFASTRAAASMIPPFTVSTAAGGCVWTSHRLWLLLGLLLVGTRRGTMTRALNEYCHLSIF